VSQRTVMLASRERNHATDDRICSLLSCHMNSVFFCFYPMQFLNNCVTLFSCQQ
jgi:hypothetical protein